MSSGQRRKSLEDIDSPHSHRELDRRLDPDRLIEVMARMERGDAVPLNPAWLERVPPLSEGIAGG